MLFKDLKVGDKVFVSKLPDSRIKNAVRTGEYKTVVKLGRVYGYLEGGILESPAFRLENGHSHHADGNARSNGWGFDVFPSEEAFIYSCAVTEAIGRIQSKLNANTGCISALPDDAILKIDKIIQDSQNSSEKGED
jgi:hypothetical protein